MMRDTERLTRIVDALKTVNLDALICTQPSNVLLLSGYWPVIGNAVAIVTADGTVAVIAPEDELQFAAESWADQIRTFSPGSLDRITDTLQSVRGPLCDTTSALGLIGKARVGLEGSGAFEPSTYASTYIYGAAVPGLMAQALPDAVLIDATEMLARLRSVLTPRELSLLRNACLIARDAFVKTVAQIQEGNREFEIAAHLRSRLMHADCRRCDGFAYCMSGPNSAQAYAAFQHSGAGPIARGDFVLLHCNSYCGGLWTDITRTIVLGTPTAEQNEIREAILAASRCAVSTVAPGVPASSVDAAARRVLEERGFGREFKHATGHGVGFSAINHNARPRIHPLSGEILEPGMVFNIEPAVYIEGKGGMRHCDMVVVTKSGSELLTQFLEPSSAL